MSDLLVISPPVSPTHPHESADLSSTNPSLTRVEEVADALGQAALTLQQQIGALPQPLQGLCVAGLVDRITRTYSQQALVAQMTEEDRATFQTGDARLREIHVNQGRIKTANTWLHVAAIILGLVAAILTPFFWYAGLPFAVLAGGCMLTTFALNCKAKSMTEEAQAIIQTNSRLLNAQRQAIYTNLLQEEATSDDIARLLPAPPPEDA